MTLYSFGDAAFLWLLLPAIDHATNAGRRQRFNWLHGLSVVVMLGPIATTGWLLVKLT